MYQALDEAPEDMLKCKEVDKHNKPIIDPSKRKSDTIEREAKNIQRQIDLAAKMAKIRGDKILAYQSSRENSASNSDISNSD